MSAAVDRVMERLSGIRQTAAGRWIACCPSHEDRSPSLSIRETDDGRVLLHDFGRCETGDVLAAIGLTLSDLFDRPLDRRHTLPPVRSHLSARELLELVSHELDVAGILLTQIIEDKSCSELAWERLAQAAQRINQARSHLR